MNVEHDERFYVILKNRDPIDTAPIASSMTIDVQLHTPQNKLQELIANVERVIFGREEAVTLAIVGLLAEGHILLEDAPGTGKTTLARALARSVDVQFSRIQFTSDLLPADVLGFSVLRAEGEFEFRPGPIFGNIVLADELNRSTPRTQSALLEAMNERRVSLDGKTRELDDPFLVIATQNPLEFEGTYPLPESQLDRFLLRIRMGYPDRDVERRVLLSRARRDPIEDIASVISREELRESVLRVRAIRFDEALMDYLLDLTTATRESGHFLVGASPRASLGLMRAAQALALIEGREFCVPDDIKRLAVPVLAHRLVTTHSTDNRASEEALIELLDSVPIP